MVQSIINGIFTDGQLDECELTLKDLHQIARSFTTILSSIHHQRVEYPASAGKETAGKKRANGDLYKQSAKTGRDRHGEAAKGGEEDLKRPEM